jgi:hypothetical protein
MTKPLATDTMERIFGSPFAAFMTEPVLVIGKDSWNRFDLADMGVTQLRAARIVSQLAKDYRAKDTADLYIKIGPTSLANSPGVGLHSFFVIWRAFETHGLNPTKWYANGREGAIVTFLTTKARAVRDASREKKARPRRAQIALDEQRGKA